MVPAPVTIISMAVPNEFMIPAATFWVAFSMSR
jgi:hypothetical protein